MNKISMILLIVVFSITLLLPTSCRAEKKIDKPSVIIGGQVVTVEIADSEAERMQGLMGRKHLSENAGMLFIFDEPLKPVFWMKDCFIPLDIIFIRNARIVTIYTSVPPCKIFPCEKYPSLETVDRVLEVNAGFVKKHNVKINDIVKYKGFRLK